VEENFRKVGLKKWAKRSKGKMKDKFTEIDHKCGGKLLLYETKNKYGVEKYQYICDTCNSCTGIIEPYNLEKMHNYLVKWESTILPEIDTDFLLRQFKRR